RVEVPGVSVGEGDGALVAGVAVERYPGRERRDGLLEATREEVGGTEVGERPAAGPVVRRVVQRGGRQVSGVLVAAAAEGALGGHGERPGVPRRPSPGQLDQIL